MPPSANQADLDRLIADGIGLGDGFLVVGAVEHLDFELDQGVALLQRLADEVIGKLNVELGMAVLIGRARPLVEFA